MDLPQPFARILEVLPDLVSVVGPDHRYRYVNPAYERAHGVPPERIIGTHVSEYLQQETFEDEVKPRLDQCLAGEEVRFGIWISLKAAGRRYLDVSLVPISSDAVAVVARDETERELRSLALQQSEERYRSLVDTAGSMVVVLSPDAKILEWNRKAEQLSGWKREEVLGNDYFELWLPDPAQARARQELDAILAGKASRGFENPFRCRDGRERLMMWNATCWLDRRAEPAGVIWIGQDITERQRAEETRVARLKTQRDLLVQAVNDRIGNHLQAVIALLRDDIRETPEIAEPMERAIGHIRSIALVHGLQGRRIYGDVILCDLVAAIGTSLDLAVGRPLRHEMELPGRFSLKPREAVPMALVINELLANAVRHAPAGGRVSVRVTGDGRPARLEVHTAGASLPPGFDFEQGRGLGAGLELARSMLPEEGARLTFRSDEQGVTVELVLTSPVIERVEGECGLSDESD